MDEGITVDLHKVESQYEWVTGTKSDIFYLGYDRHLQFTIHIHGKMDDIPYGTYKTFVGEGWVSRGYNSPDSLWHDSFSLSVLWKAVQNKEKRDSISFYDVYPQYKK